MLNFVKNLGGQTLIVVKNPEFQRALVEGVITAVVLIGVSYAVQRGIDGAKEAFSNLTSGDQETPTIVDAEFVEPSES